MFSVSPIIYRVRPNVTFYERKSQTNEKGDLEKYVLSFSNNLYS